MTNRIATPRPLISPLTLSLCWGFAVVNVLLGLGIALLYRTTVPLAVANILTYEEWGIVFMVLGLAGIYFLVIGRSEIVRATQAISVSVKMVWLVALVIRCFFAPQSIIITLVWAFFTYVQMMVYIHFDTSLSGMLRGGGK